MPFKWVKKFDKRLAVFECRGLPTDANSYVRMISGSFMVADIDKFKEIKGFDERFFMYFEDNDLCLSFEKQVTSYCTHPFMQLSILREGCASKCKTVSRVFDFYDEIFQ